MNTFGRAFPCAAEGLPARGRLASAARALAALVPAAALLAFATAAPDAQATFAAQCSGCHGITDPGRINAANASAVVHVAAQVNAMAPITSATDVSQAVADIAAAAPTPASGGGVTWSAWNAATTSVAYGGTRAVSIPNISLGGVLSSVTHAPAVTGVSFAGTTMTFNHPGGAGGNCTTRTINARGTGAAVGGITPNTANRVITVTVTAPPAPTAINDSTTIAYSTGATTIDLGAIGAISGTLPATGSLVNLGTLSPNVGSRSATGPDTLTYASSSSTYAPTLTLTYSIDGPCGTVSATRTLTINVNPPPAPVVNHASTAGSPLIVPAGAPMLIDLGPTITGVVLSNPAGVYPLTASQPTAPGSGTTSVAGNVVTYDPGPFVGATTFTYTKTGPGGVSNTETVFLEVTAAPIVSPTAVTTAFNTAIPVSLAAFITSTQPVTSVTPSAPVNGTAAATGPTTITFTPTAGFFGTASFNYVATNAGGTSTVPATVTVTVNPPPATASATTMTAAFNSGSPVISTPLNLAPSIGPAGATVLAVTPSGAVNGSVVATGPTTISFTPTAGYIGPASFTYTATNAGGTSAPATVSVTVSPPPPPTAAPVTVLVSATMPTQFDLAPYISGLYTAVSIASPPNAGSAALAGTRVTYTPQAGFTDLVTFTYQATGPGGTSAPGLVALLYTNAPVTSSRTLVVAYNVGGTIDLTDALAGNITGISISQQPAHGRVTIDGARVTYKPDQDYIGADSFQFTATGPGGTSAPGTVSITVNPPAPISTGLAVDVGFNTPTVINLAPAVGGVPGTFTITRPPANGTVVVAGALATYTPNPGYAGADSFTFVAVNASGTSDPATVSITVASVAPTAAAASLTVPANGSGTLDLAPFITGSLITGVSISVLPSHGLADVSGTMVTYTPRTGFFGSDTFTYVAYGNAGVSKSVVVSVTVVGRPDPSQDPTVRSLLESQVQTARRFARAQIGNFQRRLESLHVGPPASAPAPEAPAAAPAAATAPAATAARNPAPPLDPFAGPDPRSGFVPVGLPAAAAQPPAKNAQAGVLERALAGTLVSAATSKSVDVSGATGGTAASPGRAGATNLWTGGLAHFGKRGGGDEGAEVRFSTDGLSLGADRRLSDRLVLGLGLGYGRDETDIGSDGSRSRSRGTAFAAYGSYQPSRSVFVDAVLGIGKLDIDTDRYVPAMEEFATGNRKGDQIFASVAAGYELRREGLLLAPYGRIDFTADKLKAAAESGAGLHALAFHEQTIRSTQAAAGLRLETRHETDYGFVAPRARLEYRREFESGRTASISYADQFGGTGPVYSVSPAGTSRNSLLFGVGADFLWRRGLRLGIDYQGERNSNPGTSQSIRFLLSQDLDGRLPAWPWSWSWKPFTDPVGVEAGFSFDDNVSRGRLASEKFSDRVYSLGLNASRTFPITEHSRAVATAFLNVDKFHDHTGLGRTSGGLQGELQYRASGDFDTVTYALFARGWIDGYESKLRSGSRLSAGVNARRSLTDRIDVFGEIGGNWRRAESDVFEGKEVAAKFNLDYSLGAAGVAYLAGEFRHGDTFASGFGSLDNLNGAEVLTRDDAFDRGDIFAYRFRARTLIGTLGYNRPLGPRDSIDFSWRRVQTTPNTRPESGPSSYNVNQYSILYLMRF